MVNLGVIMDMNLRENNGDEPTVVNVQTERKLNARGEEESYI